MTAVFNELVRCIHNGKNPYDGFPVGRWPGTDYGFLGETTLLELAMTRCSNPYVVIEVGAFLGASARWWARWQKTHNIDGAVVCVDTWLAEQILWTIPEHRERLTFEYGRPHAYEIFMQNTLDAGLQDYIVPLPMDSRSGLRFLKSINLQSPVVYIDASHVEGDVYADLTLGWEVLHSGGMLLIDDYNEEGDHMFDGLIRDVDKFVEERGLPMGRLNRKAYLFKPVEAQR